MKIVKFFFLICLVSITGHAQNHCRIKVNGKYGFIDTIGNVVIQPVYDYAQQFSEGYAMYRIGDDIGYIDTTGKIRIKGDFDGGSHFSNGLAIVHKNGNYGCIDREGNQLIDFTYEWMTSALLSENRIGYKENGLWGYVDFHGNKIIPPVFSSIGKFNEGTARVGYQGKYGVIDTLGNYILPPKFTMVRGGSFFCNRIAVQERGKKAFYVDRFGNEITAAKFEFTSSFSEGLAFVKENYLEDGYYIDTNGNKAINASFQKGGLFKEGLAVVRMSDKYGVINRKGDFIVPPVLDGLAVFYQRNCIIYWKKRKKGNRYGLIDKQGNFITRPIFSSILVRDGDCPYPELYRKGESSYDDNTLVGYVNASGEVIWKPQQ